jgi:alginate O-acetyltransferase complex protein AlgJ
MVMSQPKALLPEHCLIFGSSSSYSMLDYLSRIFQTLTMVHTAGNVDQQLLSELKPRFLITQTNARFIVRAPNMDYRLVKSIAEKVQRDTPEQISQQKQALSAMLAAKPHPVAEIVHQYFLAATTPF